MEFQKCVIMPGFRKSGHICCEKKNSSMNYWSTLCNSHDGLTVLLEYLMVTLGVFLLLSSVINDAQILHVGFTMTKLWPLAVKSV